MLPLFVLKTFPQVLIITKADENSLFPDSVFSKICFAPTAERGEENYDLLYLSSIKKYEDGLEH